MWGDRTFTCQSCFSFTRRFKKCWQLFDSLLTHNRQLAKLLSGNEVRGKVAIAALQEGCQFDSFAIDMVSKSFLSTISSRFRDVLTLTIYLQIFCEFKTHFFGEESRYFRQETTVHGPQWGRRRWRGMSCSCAVVHRLPNAVSIFFFFK